MYELAKAAVNELISRDAIFGARDWTQGRAGSDRSQRQATFFSGSVAQRASIRSLRWQDRDLHCIQLFQL